MKLTYSSSSKKNRGKILLAGSTVAQWQKWYKQLIVPYKPKAVVIYVGTNDLAGGASWESTVFATWDLIEKIQKKLPKTPIYYVSMCPCESRPGLWKDINKCNKYMKKYCGWNKNLYYINLFSYFTRNGKPKAGLFREDKLHPNSKGYTVWKNVVAKKVKKDLKK